MRSKTHRVSSDQIVNERGKYFLDLLEIANLTALNGSTVGDCLGEYTCLEYNGASIPDYIALSQNLKFITSFFKVLDLTPISDHRPLHCSINLPFKKMDACELESFYEDAPIKPKWSGDASSNKFRNEQDSPDIKARVEKLLKMECSSESDVHSLNSEIIQIYQTLAESTSDDKGKKTAYKNVGFKHLNKSKLLSKNKWFDSSCIILKRELNILAQKYGRNPMNDNIRLLFYAKKKAYKKHIKLKKYNYFKEINTEILQNGNISWKEFQKLKTAKIKENQLDIYDMEVFYNFFKNLYKKRNINDNYKQSNNTNAAKAEIEEILNKEITLEEITEAIKELKNGKAIGEDRILNEFIKSSNTPLLKIIQKLFNSCLDQGVYPWNINLVNPLYKKGYRYNPDNYRAIAIGSNIGKLFSSILLARLNLFRIKQCPDTPNQQGFCKKAQTSDHILTLTTCIEKYTKKLKKRVFSCFVDFHKAFDTVSREALLFKLHDLGIRGKFLSCLSYMYKHSKAKVKIAKKLSHEIDILAGTEQGHPLSAELFKCYILDLSEKLNNVKGISVPNLNDHQLSHLLWADDLVLIALDKSSLQKLINVLETFCDQWGLEVNLLKTAIMVFNQSGRLLKDSYAFFYRKVPIPPAKTYSYLGITFTLNGGLIAAQQNLRIKGLRAYFSLKNTIDITSISKKALLKLFDALVMPILSYGSNIWLPSTQFVKSLLNNCDLQITSQTLQKISQDPLEKVHISFLKWTMGVRKKTSNAPVWGDFGRAPLAVRLIKQLLDYHNRLSIMNREDSLHFVRHAYVEQQQLNLSWFSSIASLTEKFDSNSKGINKERTETLPNSKLVRDRTSEWFMGIWNVARKQNKKLEFYNMVKGKFEIEPYLNIQTHQKYSKYTAWLRTSSHKLHIETGRYNNTPDFLRKCPTCCLEEKEDLELLAALPMCELVLVIEDEKHFLKECHLYDEIRQNTSETLQKAIEKDIGSIFSADNIVESIMMIKNMFRTRFPYNKKKKMAENTKEKTATKKKTEKIRKKTATKKKTKKRL